MENSLDNEEESSEELDDINERVRTSRLLGQNSCMVLHGGGNTSVKIKRQNIFGEDEDILCVKGSGWDLANISEEGFVPVKMKNLEKLTRLNILSDTEMVKEQRLALTNPFAPNPSVEAILHAIIPFKFVDHTHADSVVTLTNTPNGLQHVKNVYGTNVLVIPYLMPGFILAKAIYKEIQKATFDWCTCKGIILMNHGIFTFSDIAQESYDNMLELVDKATIYLAKFKPLQLKNTTPLKPNLTDLASLRQKISTVKKEPVLMRFDDSEQIVKFSSLDNMGDLATKGPLTPDHVIRTKLKPLIIKQDDDIHQVVNRYATDYKTYFDKHTDGQLICLDKAPRWALWQNMGAFIFGKNSKEISIIDDIKDHTLASILKAEALESWQPLPAKDIFEIEYWELEQNKLKNQKKRTPFTGRIALVTGAANGIGAMTVEALVKENAAVIAFDIDPKVETYFKSPQVKGFCCDLVKIDEVKKAIERGIYHFGGIDMLVLNAGIFPKSAYIESLNLENWQKSLDINLTASQNILKEMIPFLKKGINPSVVIVGSKNVDAPGYGASAYSVAKAGLVQLARIAALELSQYKINVNIVHPDAVYDTGIWTQEILEARAKHYGLSVEAYKNRNLLKTEIYSVDVANLIVTLLNPLLSKITGAQIPIDGGSDRII